MGPAILAMGDQISDTLPTPGGGVRVIAIRPNQTVPSPVNFGGAKADGPMYPLAINGGVGADLLSVYVVVNQWTFLSDRESEILSANPWIDVRLPGDAPANTQVHFLLSTDNPGA